MSTHQPTLFDTSDDRWQRLSERLRATERRLGIKPDVWNPDDDTPRQRAWHHRVRVGGASTRDLRALFVVYDLADARAVIELYGGEARPHLVEICQPDRDGAMLGVYQLRRGRWTRQAPARLKNPRRSCARLNRSVAPQTILYRPSPRAHSRTAHTPPVCATPTGASPGPHQSGILCGTRAVSGASVRHFPAPRFQP